MKSRVGGVCSLLIGLFSLPGFVSGLGAAMSVTLHPSIPGQLGIQSIPAVFAFVNGQPVAVKLLRPEIVLDAPDLVERFGVSRPSLRFT